MAYHYDHPWPSARRIDIPSVAGFAMAAVGASALIIEVNIRGWLGFAASGVDLAVVTVWLTLAGLLSAWAFQRGDGWWQALAAAGVLLSVVAMAVLVVLAIFWLLVNFPRLVTGKRGGGGKQRKRW